MQIDLPMIEKSEAIEFLEMQRAQIEDALYSLGAIEDVTVGADTINNMIQQAFRFLELQIEEGNYEDALRELKVRKWSTRKWL